MMSSFNPTRELHIDASFIATTTGTWVPLNNFVGPVTVVVLLASGLAAATVVSFEGAAEDPANICNPLTASISAINKGGFCSASSALTIPLAVAANDAQYNADGFKICREVIQCPGAFLRAKLSVADAAVKAVIVMGKARRQDQI